MGDSGVVHDKEVKDEFQIGLDALAKIKKDSGLFDVAKKKKELGRYHVYEPVIDGFKPTRKNKLTDAVTFVEQVDSKGRIIQHYVGQCEETGNRRMLSRVKV